MLKNANKANIRFENRPRDLSWEGASYASVRRGNIQNIGIRLILLLLGACIMQDDVLPSRRRRQLTLSVAFALSSTPVPTFVAVMAGATAGAIILGIVLVRYSRRKEKHS